MCHINTNIISSLQPSRSTTAVIRGKQNKRITLYGVSDYTGGGVYTQPSSWPRPPSHPNPSSWHRTRSPTEENWYPVLIYRVADTTHTVQFLKLLTIIIAGKKIHMGLQKKVAWIFSASIVFQQTFNISTPGSISRFIFK